MKNIAIILAGGSGIRFNQEIPKQLVKVAGKTVIEHTINAFERHHLIDEIYIVVNKSYYNDLVNITRLNGYKKVSKILYGGESRQESSRIGVMACEDAENILIHDAVRLFVSEKVITEVILTLDDFAAVDVAIPTVDTIIEVDAKKLIRNIPDRTNLFRGQTPQGFKLSIIKEAHSRAEQDGFGNAVDDCSLVMKYDLCRIKVIYGDECNIKITYPIDLHISDKLFQLSKIKPNYVDSEDLKEYIKNKVVVIFGGESGIGSEITKLCTHLGGYVYSFSRRTKTNIQNYDQINEALQKVYDVHEKIDFIICTVGILNICFIESSDVTNIVEHINTNLIGNLLVAKASIPYLKESRGALLFFASSSYTRGRPGYTPYSASKAGLINFVQGFSDEIIQYGIRVNVINPERTDTPLRRRNFGNEERNNLLSPKYVAKVSVGVLMADITGSVIDIRKADENSEKKF